jgi:hypothetical protein
MFILDPGLDFLPIPDPGITKAPDPGSATLLFSAKRSAQCTRGWSVRGSALLSETSPAHTAICPGTGSSTTSICSCLRWFEFCPKNVTDCQCSAMSFFAYLLYLHLHLKNEVLDFLF